MKEIVINICGCDFKLPLQQGYDKATLLRYIPERAFIDEARPDWVYAEIINLNANISNGMFEVYITLYKDIEKEKGLKMCELDSYESEIELSTLMYSLKY